MDSTKLAVCDNHRIHSHKVFKKLAARGKTSTGWFYGLKLHLIINEQGGLMAIWITSGNVSDNNPGVMRRLSHNLQEGGRYSEMPVMSLKNFLNCCGNKAYN